MGTSFKKESNLFITSLRPQYNSSLLTTQGLVSNDTPVADGM